MMNALDQSNGVKAGLTGLETEDAILLRGAATSVRSIGPRCDLLRDGEKATDAFLVLEDWGMRYKDLDEGSRQIIAFLLPGDLCLNLPGETVSHSVGSLTGLRVAVIPLDHLERLMPQRPELGRAVWRRQLVTNAMQLQWLGNSGRPAYQRLAHLLCELFARAKAAGLANGNSCDFPPTQFDLACALGLTAVHVNRTLQHLRQDRLIELHAKRLTLLDPKGLGDAAQFDRGYLHLSAG